MKMIDYRRSAADDSTCRFFLERRTAFPHFWWNFFRPLKPDCLWIVGGWSGARQTVERGANGTTE
jgi:hypothetical protein